MRCVNGIAAITLESNDRDSSPTSLPSEVPKGQPLLPPLPHFLICEKRVTSTAHLWGWGGCV